MIGESENPDKPFWGRLERDQSNSLEVVGVEPGPSKAEQSLVDLESDKLLRKGKK